MQRPSESIERILRHAGSDKDAELVGEYIAAIEADVSRKAAIREHSLRPKRLGPKPFVDYQNVSSLWQAGETVSKIASTLGIKVNTAGARVRRSRQLLGNVSVPNRKSSGMPRRPSVLDAIHSVGDTVHVPLAEIRTRQSLHQAALTRGFKIRVGLNPAQSEWIVTAKEVVTPLAVRRRKPAQSTVPESSMPATD